MGQGNTIVSHFVVQRANFIVAIACVLCGPRHSLIYAWECGFWVCWKTVCCCRIKPDCCCPPAVVSIFTDSAACVLSFYHSTPSHWYNRYLDMYMGTCWLHWILCLQSWKSNSTVMYSQSSYKAHKPFLVFSYVSDSLFKEWPVQLKFMHNVLVK